MKKRIKLKRKHCLIISVLIGLIVCVSLISIMVVNNSYPKNEDLPIFITMMIVGIPALVVISYHILDMIFNVEETEKKETTFLSEDDFTQVFYNPTKWYTSEEEMILSILEKEKIKFLAKLMEDEKILLVVKNRNDENIYSCEISNYYYFEEHFLKEKI